MPSATTKSPHVLILGAGLAGLTFAQGLRKLGISYEIFERDESAQSRSQGWAIAIHTAYDDVASILPDDVPSLETTNHLLPLDLHGKASFIIDGKKYEIEQQPYFHFLRANRLKLRHLLRTNIPVQWNKQVEKIEESSDSVTLHFKDGSSATGDLLVGADGANSVVRPHVDKSAKPKSLPLGFINGELKLDQSQYQSQFSIGRSFYVTFSKEYSLFVGVNRISEDEKLADYYWFFTWQDTAAASPDYWTHKATKAEIYKKMKEAAKEFPEELRGVLDLTKEENILTPPLKLRTCTVESIPNGRVTLMGDAAHTVTPFRGDGGNNAMKDAVNLIRQISKSDGTNLLQLVREYEKEMLPRAKEIVQLSRCGRTDEDEAVKEGLNIWKLSTTSGVQDMLRNKESWGSENDGGKEAYGTK